MEQHLAIRRPAGARTDPPRRRTYQPPATTHLRRHRDIVRPVPEPTPDCSVSAAGAEVPSRSPTAVERDAELRSVVPDAPEARRGMPRKLIPREAACRERGSPPGAADIRLDLPARGPSRGGMPERRSVVTDARQADATARASSSARGRRRDRLDRVRVRAGTPRSSPAGLGGCRFGPS